MNAISAGLRARRRPSLACTAFEDRCVPATLTVNDDGGAGFASIAAAVAAAGPNDTIKIQPGTYTEVLNIPADKPGLTLRALPGVVLQSPAEVEPDSIGGSNVGEALIDVRAARTTVCGFTIDGSTNTDGDLYTGIRVLARGATLKNNTVTGLTTTADPNFGIGIQVGTRRGSGTAGSATVTGNTVADYLGAGIVVAGAGTSADIRHNPATGRGAANDDVAQYGIQVSFGASAQVARNTVRDNSAAGNSGGIFFYEAASRTSATNNTLACNEIGVWLFETDDTFAGHPRVEGNKVTASGFAGIYLDGADGVVVRNNRVTGSEVNGIASLASSHGRIENNVASDNGSDGIYLFGVNGGLPPILSLLPPDPVLFDGIRLDGMFGMNNTVRGNTANDNGENGIFLEETTANSVLSNTVDGNCLTGIKVLDGERNVLVNNAVRENAADGVFVQDATGTVIGGNRIKDNGGYGVRFKDADATMITGNRISGNEAGSVFADADSTGVVLFGNVTDDTPIGVGGFPGFGG